MLVSDILLEAMEITGLLSTPPQSILLFKRISRAIQDLSRKGNWDALQLYMDINVQPGQNIIILPREVLSPISFTINKMPAFSRDRLYEFSLMGPGTQDALYDFQWMEQNSVPLLADLQSVGTQLFVTISSADNGANISFFGLDNQGNEISETITGDGTGRRLTSINSYAIMRRVEKDITQNRVLVQDSFDNALANYYPDETEPRYRKIKLSVSAVQVHLLFKRTTLAVNTPSDYIPLDSESAIISMLRANEARQQEGTADEIKKHEDRALQLLKEEQDSRNAFKAIATAGQLAPGVNLNINNRDSLIAADLLDETYEIFGPIGQQKAFDKMTVALDLLNNKSPEWEGSEGYLDICVGHGGLITLPRYVLKPIKINKCHHHLQMRNKWFEFHLDGPDTHHHTHPSFWDDRGDVVTITDPRIPFQLVPINDAQIDEGATVTVYGYDPTGKWIVSPNPDVDSLQQLIDGYQYTASYGNTFPDPNSPIFARIERIIRSPTNGFQQLLAYTTDGNQIPILIGYYYPDETEPKYSRIQLPHFHHLEPPFVRMRYRKRHRKIMTLTDPLNLRSHQAVKEIMLFMKQQPDKPDDAKKHEASAQMHMQEEFYSSNPSEVYSMEVDPVIEFAPHTPQM